MSGRPTRRRFLAATSATAGMVAVRPLLAAEAPAFRSAWDRTPDRIWPGPEYWANPQQDWQVANGRLRCVKAAPSRTVHLLTFDSQARAGTLELSVRLSRPDGTPIRAGAGSAGFSIGVKSPLREYRHNLIYGSGFNAGLRATGELFIGDGPNGKTAPADLSVAEIELRLEAVPAGDRYQVELSAREAGSGRELGVVRRDDVPSEFLDGNLALAANFGPPGGRPRQTRNDQPDPTGVGRWDFADWRVGGGKVEAHPDRAFGSVLFTQYTLHRGILKLTAQLAAIGRRDDAHAVLQRRVNDGWKTLAQAPVDALARCATFRIENWDASADTPVRVTHVTRDSNGVETLHAWEALIRREPSDRDTLTVADISCNAHYAFPNTDAVAQMARLNPDLLAFTGDQYYEPSGGYGVDASSVENACLDVLRKWSLHGWTWRELMRDRPSVSIPDDHDVYHGNLWGEGGKAASGNNSPAESKGGYKLFADFVNAVHRFQTAHHPDSPGHPGLQGISAYYGPLTYGGVSFAILADRQYKSGPDGRVPPTTSGRADHVKDPNFDPQTADVAGLELLGEAQMEFLRRWTLDWKDAEMKAVISQTVFTAMATHHGGRDNFLRADYDTNAWPQTARNAALREIRKSFAFHIAGDQHLPAVIQYGIEGHRDAAVAFAGPAVNNLYPRWFLPPDGRIPGDHVDSFGHPMTVLACANPKTEIRAGVLEAEEDKAAGIAVVRFDKRHRTITIECWPLRADVTRPGTQLPGWPVTVAQLDSAGHREWPQLPRTTVQGIARPLFEVRTHPGGELVYAYRATGPVWQPFAPKPGTYEVKVTDPETGRSGSGRFEAARNNAATWTLNL
jgi:hypothetical protein